MPPNHPQLLLAILIAFELRYVHSKDSISPQKPRHAHLGLEKGELPHWPNNRPTRPQPFDHRVIGLPGSRLTTRFPQPHNHHHQKVLNHCPLATQTGNYEYQMCNCGFGSWTQVGNLRLRVGRGGRREEGVEGWALHCTSQKILQLVKGPKRHHLICDPIPSSLLQENKRVSTIIHRKMTISGQHWVPLILICTPLIYNYRAKLIM